MKKIILNTSIVVIITIFSIFALPEQSFAQAFSPTAATCTDGIDNDDDDIVDEADECPVVVVAPTPVIFTATAATCADGIDNDGDDIVDEADECPPVVVVPPVIPPFVPTAATCTDGIDNDGDDIVDEADECPPVVVVTDATITIEKIVINDDGRTKVESDFVYRIDGVEVLSGAPLTYTAGSYTLSEDSDSDYVASTWGGDCATDGTITVSDGDSVVCTITNDDVAAVSTPSSGGGGGGSSNNNNNDEEAEAEVLGASIDLEEPVVGEVLGAAIDLPTVPHTGTGVDFGLYLAIISTIGISTFYIRRKLTV